MKKILIANAIVGLVAATALAAGATAARPVARPGEAPRVMVPGKTGAEVGGASARPTVKNPGASTAITNVGSTPSLNNKLANTPNPIIVKADAVLMKPTASCGDALRGIGETTRARILSAHRRKLLVSNPEKRPDVICLPKFAGQKGAEEATITTTEAIVAGDIAFDKLVAEGATDKTGDGIVAADDLTPIEIAPVTLAEGTSVGQSLKSDTQDGLGRIESIGEDQLACDVSSRFLTNPITMKEARRLAN
jgi:hypothetical protein